MVGIADGAIVVAKAAPPQLVSIAGLWDNPANIAARPHPGVIEYYAVRNGGDPRAWIKAHLPSTYTVTRARRNGGTLTRNALVGAIVLNQVKRNRQPKEERPAVPVFTFFALVGEADDFEATMSAGLSQLLKQLGPGNWLGVFDQTATLRPEIDHALVKVGFVAEPGIPNNYFRRRADDEAAWCWWKAPKEESEDTDEDASEQNASESYGTP